MLRLSLTPSYNGGDHMCGLCKSGGFSIKPFLKWAGGKTQLLPQIDNNLPIELKNNNIKKYIEPFVGGGAVLFYLLQKYDFEEVIINDVNEDLILTYKIIKNKVDDLISELNNLKNKYLSLNDDNRKDFLLCN